MFWHHEKKPCTGTHSHTYNLDYCLSAWHDTSCTFRWLNFICFCHGPTIYSVCNSLAAMFRQFVCYLAVNFPNVCNNLHANEFIRWWHRTTQSASQRWYCLYFRRVPANSILHMEFCVLWDAWLESAMNDNAMDTRFHIFQLVWGVLRCFFNAYGIEWCIAISDRWINHTTFHLIHLHSI